MNISEPDVAHPPDIAVLIEAMIPKWANLEAALKALSSSAESIPPLQSATSSLISCLGLFEDAMKIYKGYDISPLKLENVAKFLAQHLKDEKSARTTNVIIRISQTLDAKVRRINEERDRSDTKRRISTSRNVEDLIAIYRQIEVVYRRIQEEVSLSAWSIERDDWVNTHLGELNSAKLANYDSKLGCELRRRACTEGTREKLLSKLSRWSDDPHGKRIYYLSGVEGGGKTTIAYSLAKMLESRGQLGASFFCTRASPGCRDATRIIPSIAFQFAQHSTFLLRELCEAVEDKPIRPRKIAEEFKRLVEGPLLKAEREIPRDLIVIIDALDECDDSDIIKLFICVLLRFADDLPIKFFITSRPDPNTHYILSQSDEGGIKNIVMHLHEIEEPIVRSDIKTYLREELAPMAPLGGHIDQVADLTGNLFIHASAVVRCFRANGASMDLHEQLKIVQSAKSKCVAKPLRADELYHALLAMIFDNSGLGVEELNHGRLVLWAAVCMREPVTLEALTALAGMSNKEHTIAMLQSLQPVLRISKSSQLISVLSTSFRDYMLNQGRSGRFSCNEAAQNQLHARRCFEVMKARLRFNICDLESSLVLDKSVNDLDERVEKCILPDLAYACRYWGNHLQLSSISDDLCGMLREFLSSRFLFWMEVLNLKRWMKDGIKGLLKAEEWLKTTTGFSDLRRFISDAYIFLYRFAAAPVSESTPHIYISALALCPRSSFVSTNYRSRMQGLIDANGTAICNREPAAMATWFDQGVGSAVFLPDGKNIVSGSANGTIRIRDSVDGSIIAGPFRAWASSTRTTIMTIEASPDGTLIASGSSRGVSVWNLADGTAPSKFCFQLHSGSVLSVGFSPDSTQIVSGSVDRTIIVWDISKELLAAGPFEGHSRPVYSVQFSPDGKRIVSSSYDCTIRVWDIAREMVVVGPIMYSDPVTAVAFSPDGTRIASGSSNSTICIWDAADGTPVAGPFHGHTGTIRCLRFSPDGTSIASGSVDSTIRIWDIRGALIAGPFLGHDSPIRSVSFSPNGTRMVSCARDSTIRLWDITRDTPTLRSFIGRTTGNAQSVAFSPDGTRIVSGVVDHAICVWGATDGVLIAGPFEGHTGRVLSVAFSPDGARVVSGSEDRTVIIWDVPNRTLVVGPLLHHTNAVQSVLFSPDGARIISGSADGTICVWDSINGALVAGPCKGDAGSIFSVAFSPDGARVASGSEDCTVRLWDPIRGISVASPFEGHTSSVLSVGFSPNGMRIVSGSDDCTVCVWDATNGTIVSGPFTGHTSDVNSVAFSPDGTCVVSGSSDCTIRIWHVSYGVLAFRPFEVPNSDIQSVGFSPDGKQLVSCSSGAPGQRTSIRVWNIYSGDQIPVPLRGQWSRGLDRWISNYRSEPLFWAPFEIRGDFPTPCNPLIIDPKGALQVDYSNMLLGGRWRECYIET